MVVPVWGRQERATQKLVDGESCGGSGRRDPLELFWGDSQGRCNRRANGTGRGHAGIRDKQGVARALFLSENENRRRMGKRGPENEKIKKT